MQRAIVWLNGQIEPITDFERISDYLANPHATLWVDMVDPQPSDIRCLNEEFAFHHLSIEDVTHAIQRPKIEVYPTYYFMVFFALGFPNPEASLEYHEMDIFIGSNYVVTAHSAPLKELDEAWEHWCRRAEVIGSDVGALLYNILDHVVDEYFPVVDALADRTEDIEESIFGKFDAGALEDIFRLKKDLLALRRVVAPQRDVLNVLLRRDPPILPANTVLYFQDVYDHLLRILDSIDVYRDLLSSALDAYLSVQSNNLNQVMRRLTVISVIFLPLTFLTGFFGMNFESMPFGDIRVFWVSLVIMLLIPVGMAIFFRWRGLSE